MPDLFTDIGSGVGNFVTTLIEGDANRKAAREANENNAALQREFAQHGIRWKIDDAATRGIHPLYALGAQGYQAAPSFISEGSGGMEQGLRAVGQDVSRAIAATQTERERLATKLLDLQVQREGVELDRLRSQVARENSAQVGPAFPLGKHIKDPSIPGNVLVDVLGGQMVMPEQKVAESMEDNFLLQLGHFLRNNIVPARPVKNNEFYIPALGYFEKSRKTQKHLQALGNALTGRR